MKSDFFPRIKYSLNVLTIVLLSVSSASAMSVEPMVLDLSTLGKEARQTCKVTNDGTSPLPVEISVSRLELDADGKQTVTPDDTNFLIYPAQAMIAPGASQIFRVQWIGDPELSQSQSYRFSVSQVPVKLPEGQSGIQIVMNFGVTVNVAPADGTSEIVVLGVEPTTDKNGKRVAALRVKNPGNMHAYLQNAEIRLSGGGWSAEMKPGHIAQTLGLGMVQPGKERRFILPIEVPEHVSLISASVERQ
jgi:P pilus assembly chaperone PapD